MAVGCYPSYLLGCLFFRICVHVRDEQIVAEAKYEVDKENEKDINNKIVKYINLQAVTCPTDDYCFKKPSHTLHPSTLPSSIHSSAQMYKNMTEEDWMKPAEVRHALFPLLLTTSNLCLTHYTNRNSWGKHGNS
ncbi:unnamed protein product [Thelazia callipaeda]|uniref:Secreted protein n=1 Tax=Thelazia callipaeda TaxID=103827 RepID=A0A0N5D5E0_THECL|nr:unnamed protein product [Thelazia callipaeda]